MSQLPSSVRNLRRTATDPASQPPSASNIADAQRCASHLRIILVGAARQRFRRGGDGSRHTCLGKFGALHRSLSKELRIRTRRVERIRPLLLLGDRRVSPLLVRKVDPSAPNSGDQRHSWLSSLLMWEVFALWRAGYKKLRIGICRIGRVSPPLIWEDWHAIEQSGSNAREHTQ